MYTAIRKYYLLPEAVGGGVSSFPRNSVLLMLAGRAIGTGLTTACEERLLARETSPVAGPRKEALSGTAHPVVAKPPPYEPCRGHAPALAQTTKRKGGQHDSEADYTISLRH